MVLLDNGLVDEPQTPENPRNISIVMGADYPAVQKPDLVELDTVELDDSTQVIGVEVDGQPVAFVLDAMTRPDRHIVSTMIKGKPLAVTYCDLADCARVLTNDAKELIPLRVGGLDDQNQMILLLNGQLYGQSSGALPLQDQPFARMDLKQWRELHPSSKIYLGDTEEPNGV